MQDRLRYYLKNQKITISKLATMIGAQQSILSRALSGTLTPGMTARILKACPDLSERWLLTGEGEMLRPEGVTMVLHDHARGAGRDYHEAPAAGAATSTPAADERLALTGRIDTLTAENATLKTENAALKTENATLKTENAALRVRVADLSGTITDKDRIIGLLTEKIQQ